MAPAIARRASQVRERMVRRAARMERAVSGVMHRRVASEPVIRLWIGPESAARARRAFGLPPRRIGTAAQ